MSSNRTVAQHQHVHARRLRGVVLTCALPLLGALMAAACGGSSTSSETGHPRPSGGAAEAGFAGDGSSAQGGTAAAGSGGSLAVGGSGGTSGGKGGTTGATGGSSTASGGTAGSLGMAGDFGAAGAPTMLGTACDDGLDNDGDGLVDGFDPECTGALDSDEASFATGISGDNKDPKWQDCFFDGNSGGGDDGCRYSTDCLYGATADDDPSCAVSQACIDYCARLVPNGCDCFGCCTVQTVDGDSVDIYTASTCSVSELDDEEACPRCSKSITCDNTCGECELCPGKTVADLPESCTPPDTGSGGAGGTGGTGGTDTGGTGGTGSGGTSTAGTGGTPAYTCDGGEQVCGAGLPACPTGLYCQFGCCMVVVR